MFGEMKLLKLLSFFVAAVLLATAVMIIPITAEELDTLYVTQINQRVIAASGAVFTKAFNGSNTIKSSEGNFRWTKQIICKPTNKANVYEVVEVVGNLKNGTNGDPDETITMPEGGFIYAAHVDDRQEAKDNGTFERSKANYDKLGNLNQGDKVTIYGIDIANGTITNDAVIYIGEKSDSSSSTSSSSSSSSAPSSSSSSAPASSSSAAQSSSSTSSKTSTSSTTSPKTGDEGIALFAVAALIALAGASALSIRKRSR